MSSLIELNQALKSAELIVCDFGDVLYDIDFERTRAALTALPEHTNRIRSRQTRRAIC